LFLHGHNHLFARANQVNEFGPFLRQHLFTFTSASLPGGSLTCRIGNLLGCLYSDGDTTNAYNRYYPNWLSEVVLPFVNPATHRQHLRRTGLMPYNIETTTYTTADWNPYKYIFQTENATNFNSLMFCIQSCSSFVASELSGNTSIKSLRTKVPHLPGAYIISSYIRPTWHVQDIVLDVKGNGKDTDKIPSPGSFGTMCDKQKFGLTPVAPGDTSKKYDPKYPSASAAGPDPGKLTLKDFHESLYLVDKDPATGRELPESLTTETRSEFKHNVPDILVFAPGDVPPAGCSWPMLSGMAIYNGNVDSTTLRAPNPTDSLSLVRSRYVDGFVSARWIRPKFTERPTFLVMRQALTKISYGGVNMIYQSDKVHLPTYAQNGVQNYPRWSTWLWPFTSVPRMISSFFWPSTIPNQSSEFAAANDDVIDHMQVFELWSSFRMMSKAEKPTHLNVYFGVNHGEALFGRNSTIHKFPHPAERLYRP